LITGTKKSTTSQSGFPASPASPLDRQRHRPSQMNGSANISKRPLQMRASPMEGHSRGTSGPTGCQ